MRWLRGGIPWTKGSLLYLLTDKGAFEWLCHTTLWRHKKGDYLLFHHIQIKCKEKKLTRTLGTQKKESWQISREIIRLYPDNYRKRMDKNLWVIYNFYNLGNIILYACKGGKTVNKNETNNLKHGTFSADKNILI